MGHKMTMVIFSFKNKAHIISVYGDGGLVTKSCPALATPWTVACQVPLSMGFSRQEYRSGWPFPSPGYLPDSGIEPGSPALQADSLPAELQVSVQGAKVDFCSRLDVNLEVCSPIVFPCPTPVNSPFSDLL